MKAETCSISSHWIQEIKGALLTALRCANKNRTPMAILLPMFLFFFSVSQSPTMMSAQSNLHCSCHLHILTLMSPSQQSLLWLLYLKWHLFPLALYPLSCFIFLHRTYHHLPSKCFYLLCLLSVSPNYVRIQYVNSIRAGFFFSILFTVVFPAPGEVLAHSRLLINTYWIHELLPSNYSIKILI